MRTNATITWFDVTEARPNIIRVTIRLQSDFYQTISEIVLTLNAQQATDVLVEMGVFQNVHTTYIY